jgi:RNA polymerase sigma-70 factor, ECF subfamily
MNSNSIELVSKNEISQMLVALQQGDRSVLNEIFIKLEPALHEIASRYMNRERRKDHTLQPTALVNEAYIKLVNEKLIAAGNRVEFFAIIANVMRRILVDHARKKIAEKRDWGVQAELSKEIIASPNSRVVDLIVLDEALNNLGSFDDTALKIVELRFFGGLTNDEVATVLSIDPRPVIRKWKIAFTWLKSELE